MRKILATTLAAVVSLMALVPIVLPVSSPVLATVTVQQLCDMTLSKESVTFGTPAPGSSGTPDSVTISMLNGNTPTTPTIMGSPWAGTGSNGMSIGATVWGTITPTTQLTGSAVPTAELSFGNPVTIYMNVNIPSGQAADTYTQTITFTVTC